MIFDIIPDLDWDLFKSIFETLLEKCLQKLYFFTFVRDNILNNVSNMILSKSVLVLEISKIIRDFDYKYISGHVLPQAKLSLYSNSTHCPPPLKIFRPSAASELY